MRGHPGRQPISLPNGKRVPWHEDSYYWKGMMEPMEVVTVWLAIDPSTRENGCMNVIPRSLHGYSDYEQVDPEKHVFPTEIKRHQFDESKAVAIELQPNQASLHDGRLMHGSQANTSEQRRHKRISFSPMQLPSRDKLKHVLRPSKRDRHQMLPAR